MGRLRYNDEENDDNDDDNHHGGGGGGEEISVCNFFCDVLKKPHTQRRQMARTRPPDHDNNDDHDADDDPNRSGSRFSEPLL